ncbi:MAG TPA: AraC family transcriptional regulator [Mycobacterium sp.]|nr:AraC family transcriptional regulator [Mycobacterium sp.]
MAVSERDSAAARTETSTRPVRFSTHELGGSEGRAQWTNVLEQTYCELDVLVPQTGPRFEAEIAVRPFGEIIVATTRTDPQTVVRTPAMIASDSDDDYLLCMVTEGTVELEQADRVTRLEAGSFAIADCSAPFTHRSSTVVEQVIVRAPRRSFTARMPGHALDTLTACAVDGCSGSGGLVGRLLSDIARFDAETSPWAQASLSNSALDMVVTALVDEGDAGPGLSRKHAQDFARALRTIERHLHDADFSLSDAAAELGMSLRFMQKLFQLHGTTPRAWLYQARVERARKYLLTTDMTVERISKRVGFADVSHFSRLFRTHVGVSPGQYRRYPLGQARPVEPQASGR